MAEQRNPFSRRFLSTFDISDEILTKLRSKGFTLKSEIECLTDDKLKTICDLNETQLEVIDKEIRNSHKSVIKCISVLELCRQPFRAIHTGSYSMDRAMNGGVQVTKITQISAAAGAGKTQICMQCCVNVQLPPKYGGLSGRALYIDTENSVRPERMVSMAKHRLSKHPDLMPSLTPEIIRSRVYLIRCNTNAKDLVEIVVNRIEPFIDKNPEIKLIVIDSIAQLFRYDYRGNNVQKDYELTQIAQRLKEIALHKKVAVLIANQVTFNPQLQETLPALGKYWQMHCNIGLMFTKLEIPSDGNTVTLLRQGSVLRSNESDRHQGFYFDVTGNGIQEMVPSRGYWHPDY